MQPHKTVANKQKQVPDMDSLLFMCHIQFRRPCLTIYDIFENDLKTEATKIKSAVNNNPVYCVDTCHCKKYNFVENTFSVIFFDNIRTFLNHHTKNGSKKSEASKINSAVYNHVYCLLYRHVQLQKKKYKFAENVFHYIFWQYTIFFFNITPHQTLTKNRSVTINSAFTNHIVYCVDTYHCENIHLKSAYTNSQYTAAAILWQHSMQLFLQIPQAWK